MLKGTLIVISLASVIAICTLVMLASVGVDVLGNSCDYQNAVGTVCY